MREGLLGNLFDSEDELYLEIPFEIGISSPFDFRNLERLRETVECWRWSM